MSLPNTFPFSWPRAKRAPVEHWTSALAPVIQWYLKHETVAFDAPPALPIWVAGADDVLHCRLLDWQHAVADNGDTIAIELTAKIASNRSWVNEQTLAFFQHNTVSLRGAWQQRDTQRVFVVRVLWPDNWQWRNVTASHVDDMTARIRCDQRAAVSPFAVTRLWQSSAVTPAAWVVGFILNGAQGDDDEAHGGHFAIAVGRLNEQDDPRDLVVANFYNPDVVSEKGILPAMTPLSNYFCDLNSGQQYYRPSSMVCVRLSSHALIAPLYEKLEKQMHAMLHHDWHYDHAMMNCTGITMDALRNAGFCVPDRGSAAWLAPVAFLLTLIRERDLTRAKRVWRYLRAERTRLFPAVAMLACVQHLLSLVQAHRTAQTAFEQQLCDAAVAVDYVHVPQIPSSRALGREPLFDLSDYRARMPPNRADWKIIPVQTRPFPEHLHRD